jgi:hypothetical protein
VYGQGGEGDTMSRSGNPSSKLRHLSDGCLVGAGLASAATAQSADSTTKAARLEASEVC